MVIRRSLFLLVLIALLSAHLHSQSAMRAVSTGNRQTLTLSFGAGIPSSRQGLTVFWDAGPSGAAKFLVNVSKPVALGVGIDAVVLHFNDARFHAAYPGVVPRSTQVILGSVYLAMKCSFSPAMRFSPYGEITLGATHVSEAIYEDVIDSVRVHYYNMPARTRLAVGLALGADVYLNPWLALSFETKTNYVHHDADLGITNFVRGGVRFVL